MNPKIKIATDEVKRCTKPNCSVGLGRPWRIVRHHIRHQHLFVTHFANDPRKRISKKYKNFSARYFRFNKKDTVLLCDEHHAEIHTLYDTCIADGLMLLAKPLRKLNWKQAEIMMNCFEEIFEGWIGKETEGVDPEKRRELNRLRRRLGKVRRRTRRNPEGP